MKDVIKIVMVFLVMTLVIVSVVWYHSFIWNECRGSDHSILYCMKVISK